MCPVEPAAASSGALSVRVRVPINIALIKYWGKRNAELMLPLNDSLARDPDSGCSVSLTVDELYATTRLTAQPVTVTPVDSVTINQKSVACGEGTRFGRVFDEARRLLRKRPADASDGQPAVARWQFVVVSHTNFPIEAGLASSAAGFAAIAFALGRLFRLDDATTSRLARLGSGSACRSLSDGFVHWKAGSRDDGADCCCQRSQPVWPSLRAIIAVVSAQSKQVGSSLGMARSAATSRLLTYRVQTVVPGRVLELHQAIERRDFGAFSDVVIADSNQMHAIMMDTRPPIVYLTPASLHLIAVCEAFNRHHRDQQQQRPEGGDGEERPTVAYTFDAGANCVMLLEDRWLSLFTAVLQRYAPAADANGPDKQESAATTVMKLQSDSGAELSTEPAAVQRYIHSRLGGPPLVLKDDD